MGYDTTALANKSAAAQALAAKRAEIEKSVADARKVQKARTEVAPPTLGAQAEQEDPLCLGGTEDGDLWQQGCACRVNVGVMLGWCT
jgi:hypothetical protein